MEAFLVGISTGGICLAYCAPVLVPYLLSEGKSIGANFLLLGQFLSGRLLGYLLFGVLAWGVHESLLHQSTYNELVIGALQMAFSLLLMYYGFFKQHAFCPRAHRSRQMSLVAERWPTLLPLIGGFVTGLSFCPPLYLALTTASGKENLVQSMLFFFQFFLGTAIFFFPLPITGLFRRHAQLAFVGKTAAGLIGSYYLYSGIILLIGGIKSI